MNTTTIISDPAAIEQYMTDPGKPHGLTVDRAMEVWRKFRQTPGDQRPHGAISKDSEEYRILRAYLDDDLDDFSPYQLGRLFVDHCIPSLILVTPQPEWATDTGEGFQDGLNASCTHNCDIDTGDARIHAAIEQFDEYDHSDGTLSFGEPFARLDFDDRNDEFGVEDLRKIAAAVLNAADQLEAIRAGDTK